jgi:hypothetical protein
VNGELGRGERERGNRERLCLLLPNDDDGIGYKSNR